VGAEKQYIFEPFRLDPVNEQLWRGEREIAVRRKTFEVLRYLVEHPAQLVTKTALLDAVWPRVTVNDSMPATSVGELRVVLRDEARTPRFIETVHGRGYRFIAPITKASLQGPIKPSSSPPAPAPIMVGRNEEMLRLRGWFSEALEGRRRVIFVGGEPGIGKTTVVRAFLESTPQRDGFRIACGQCIDQYGAGEPYMPVLEALTRLGQEPGGDWMLDTLHRFAPSWLAQMPALLGEAEREHLQRQAPGASQQRMLREMTQALEAMTTDLPVVLFLEDLHWSDVSTLELISAVARRTESARLLIIGTFRPVEMLGHPLRTVKEELQLHRQGEELRLKLLSEESISKYLRARFSGVDAKRWSGLAPVIHQRTEGNPLFVVNLVDYLVTRGALNPDGLATRVESARALNIGKNDVPHSILQLIERNLARLSSEEQRVLETASVAGVEFSVPAVAAALEGSASEIEICCERLSRQEQFVEENGERVWPDGTPASSFRFLHALYQEVLYRRLSAARRAELHLRMADRERAAYGARAAEVASELAHHYGRANEKGKAIEYFQLAGERAFQRGASVEMERHNTAALELLSGLPDGSKRDRQRLEILTGLATARLGSKGFAHHETCKAFSRAEELGDRLGETDLMMAALGGLSTSALTGSRMAEGAEAARRLMRLATVSGDRRLLCWAHVHLSQTGLLNGRYIETLHYLELATQYLHCPDSGTAPVPANLAPKSCETATPIWQRTKIIWDPSIMSAALTAWEADVALHLGFPDRARRLSSEALQVAQRQGSSFYLAVVQACACCLYDLLRDAPMVLEHAEALIPLAEENPAFTSYATFYAARALLKASRIGEAKDSLRRAMKFNDSTGLRLMRAWELQTEAECCAIEGRIEDALTLLTDALREAEEVAYSKPPVMILRADLLVRQGGRESVVEAAYRAALDCARDQDNRFAELEGTTHLARWLSSQGREAEARIMLSKIYNWFTEGFDTIALREAKALLDQMNQRSISTPNIKNANRELFTPPQARLINRKQAQT
jgi:DNA-binding winged helix-turn-helix (wHTH) protein/tetratricopeptide (TPR) repeat protein